MEDVDVDDFQQQCAGLQDAEDSIIDPTTWMMMSGIIQLICCIIFN